MAADISYYLNQINRPSSANTVSVSNPFQGSGINKNTVDSLLKLNATQRSNSAYDLELQAARETNAFNSRQAEINRVFQQNSAQAAMDFEAAQNQKAMDFSERMANTTYQRAIDDLKAAGLSPLLAYGNLQTSSPVGSAGSGVSSSGSTASGVKGNASSALSVEREAVSQIYQLLALNISSALSIAEMRNQAQIARNYQTANLASSALGSMSTLAGTAMRVAK